MKPAESTTPVRFTRLFATISQDDDAFTVSVRVSHHLNQSQCAWGEEIADSIEMASLMIEAIAQQFSIPQKCIAIRLRMATLKDGILH